MSTFCCICAALTEPLDGSECVVDRCRNFLVLCSESKRTNNVECIVVARHSSENSFDETPTILFAIVRMGRRPANKSLKDDTDLDCIPLHAILGTDEGV